MSNQLHCCYENMRYVLKVTVIFLSIFLVSCSEEQKASFSKFSGQLGDIYKLQSVIKEKLEKGEVGVYIQNGISLTVSLVNTEFNDKSREEREKKAEALTKEVESFINDHEDLSSVKHLFITYVINKNYLIVNSTNTVDYYRFSLEKGETEKVTQGADMCKG